MAPLADDPDDDLRPKYDFSKLRRVQRPPHAGRVSPESLRHTAAFPAGDVTAEKRMNLTPDETRKFIARMDRELMPLFTKCVLPIYGEHKDKLIQCGSGTLFRVADRSFLVSASHVTDLVAVKKVQLYASDSPQGSKAFPLEGQLHSERNLDVSVWELASHVVTQLQNRTFLSVHRADRANHRITPGWFHIHGYPNCWSETDADAQKVTVKPITYGTILYSGDTKNLGRYDPKIHLLLTMPKQRNVDSAGAETQTPIRLGGISGCSMWQSYYQGLASRQWTIDDAVVVAVQTGTYYEDKPDQDTLVRGTHWWVVEAIIAKNYPDLMGPLSIVSPVSRLPR